MVKVNITLKDTFQILEKYYGIPERPPIVDPWEQILFENVAYMANPARRQKAFAQLKDKIGTSPEAIMAADMLALEAVGAWGILAKTSAGKLRECARIAIEQFGGSLDESLLQSIDKAKRNLQVFPGIGEPGAEKILLLCGKAAFLAPDSNGLRVLGRLGFIKEDKNYSRMYQSSHELTKELPNDLGIIQKAHFLLKQHGQVLCKRNVPLCGQCPLKSNCLWYGNNKGE